MEERQSRIGKFSVIYTKGKENERTRAGASSLRLARDLLFGIGAFLEISGKSIMNPISRS